MKRGWKGIGERGRRASLFGIGRKGLVGAIRSTLSEERG